ncbi:toxin, partial [Klebsiella pneumoniae]|nr:toxin [Klebsiella pneumoniae]
MMLSVSITGGIDIVQFSVPPVLIKFLGDIFVCHHTNAKYEGFTKEQIKANNKYEVINYNGKVFFNERPGNEIVC